MKTSLVMSKRNYEFKISLNSLFYKISYFGLAFVLKSTGPKYPLGSTIQYS